MGFRFLMGRPQNPQLAPEAVVSGYIIPAGPAGNKAVLSGLESCVIPVFHFDRSLYLSEAESRPN